MRKNIWVLLLSRLLFLQIIYFGVQETEQRKDVVVPEKKEQATVPQQKTSSTDFLSETDSSEDAAVPLEELTFTINPSAEYYQINPDYVGWLSVNGTVIDYPVVRGQDNEMYLSHNFYREPDIFRSHRHGLSEYRHGNRPAYYHLWPLYAVWPDVRGIG